MTLFLFETTPPAEPPVAGSPHPSDVRRRVEHKTGPFRILRSLTDAERSDARLDHRSVIAREYVLVELHDGRIFGEFTDTGERKPPTPDITPELIDRLLRTGEWREVQG